MVSFLRLIIEIYKHTHTIHIHTHTHDILYVCIQYDTFFSCMRRQTNIVYIYFRNMIPLGVRRKFNMTISKRMYTYLHV